MFKSESQLCCKIQQLWIGFFQLDHNSFLTEALPRRRKGYLKIFGQTSLDMMEVQQFVFKTISPFVKQLRPL